MERIIEAGKVILDRQRKALALVCTVGAMVALPFIIGAPNQGHTHGNHPSPCTSNCNYSCILTGHTGGYCCGEGSNSHCDCDH